MGAGGMKKLLLLIVLGLGLLPGMAGADGSTIYLDNYYYAHANKPGVYVLSDKHNNTLLYGDYAQNDAYIVQIGFRNFQGAPSDMIKITFADGSTDQFGAATMSMGGLDPAPKYKHMKIELVKTTYDETFVELSGMNTDDASYTVGLLSYIFTGTAPTKYGDLGKGSATPTATPKPSATPTKTPGPATPTPTPAPTTPPLYDLHPYKTGSQIVWSNPLVNTDYVEVYKDGKLLTTYTDKSIATHPIEGDGTYVIKAISKQGNLIGQGTIKVTGDTATNPTPAPTDPGNPGGGTDDPGEECTAACQALIDQLDCPEWGTYMGAWSDMIKGTYPPPPDWDNVAAIMRDKIVPAMGQELVNRSPEIARIIADEFQSREKAVSPPSAVPDFTPPVPRLEDVPKVTGSINDNVPSFTPDYSEDKPFVIPDPSTMDFSDNSDDGYDYKPMVTENPDYVSSGPEPSEVDKGYEVKPQPTFIPPLYVGGSWKTSEPPPNYQTNEGQNEEIPEYQQQGEDTGSYQVYRDIPDVFQEYKGGE
jgi:hypothetical protein